MAMKMVWQLMIGLVPLVELELMISVNLDHRVSIMRYLWYR